MRIAISGADGFLGSHVLKQLQNQNRHDVVGITVCLNELSERFYGWDKLTVLHAALSQMADSHALDGVDVYLACAFPRSVGSVGMTEGLDFVYGSLGLMLDKGCKAVINVSSQSVYDSHRVAPARESDNVLLTSTYAVSKYCVELSVAHMCGAAGVPYTNVRMASLIGPGFNQRFPNKMVRAALGSGQIMAADNGSEFGFLDVLDAAEGLVRLAESDATSWEGIYNLGPARSYGITEIAQVVASEVGLQLPKEKKVQVVAAEGMGESICSAVDAEKICRLLHWKPRHEIASSVRAIVAHELSK